MAIDPKTLEAYPMIMTKEQLRIACHISKRTALYLLKYGLIPNKRPSKRSRGYRINKSDVIAYLLDREVNPQKYMPPRRWYTYSSIYINPKIRRLSPEVVADESLLRAFFEEKMRQYPDVLTVQGVADFTGYEKRAVQNWILDHRLRALHSFNKSYVPKLFLLDWLCSSDFNSLRYKSDTHYQWILELSDAPSKPCRKRDR